MNKFVLIELDNPVIVKRCKDFIPYMSNDANDTHIYDADDIYDICKEEGIEVPDGDFYLIYDL